MVNIERAYGFLRISNGVIKVSYHQDTKINLAVAKDIVEKRIQLCKGMTYPFFMNFSNVIKIDSESRKYMAMSTKYISAWGFLVGAGYNKLLGDAFLMVSRPAVPFKVFEKEKPLLHWLGYYRDLN